MVCTIQSLLAVSALLASGVFAGSSKTCPKDTPLSCSGSSSNVDKCCVATPGHMLQTQFWDTDPVTGPTDSWTIHGLWVDYCGGNGYPESCDPDRDYPNLTELLEQGGANDTLAYMKKYWKDYEGDDESFWSHEWGKHGTCITTFDPECYSNYKTGEEAVDFFEKTVELFKTLPSHEWLSAAGITPSDSKTYTSEEIQTVLKKHHGQEVTLGCDGENLNEIWYHFNVRGSIQDGKFVSVAPDSDSSTCPDDGVKYLPKKSGSSRKFVA